MVMTAHSSGNTDQAPCGLVDSESTGLYVLTLTIMMTSLLTLDHTTLFFYTLTQCHTMSVNHWWTSMKINPGSKAAYSASTVPTAPSLTQVSTHSSTSKCWSAVNNLVINFCGPTPKRLGTQGPKTTIINLEVKVAIHNDDDDDIYDGGLPNEEEMDCPFKPFEKWGTSGDLSK